MAVDLEKKTATEPNHGNDVENAHDELGEERRGSRIDRPRTGSIVGGDADSGLSVGQQIELEKGNAIQYRTCSWQKV